MGGDAGGCAAGDAAAVGGVQRDDHCLPQSELVPFFGFSEVEQIIVEAVKQGYLQACAPASPTAFAPGPYVCSRYSCIFHLSLLMPAGCVPLAWHIPGFS